MVGRGCGAPPTTSTHPQGGTRGTWVPVPGCPRGGGSAAISRLSQPHVPKPLHRHSTRGGSGETPPGSPQQWTIRAARYQPRSGELPHGNLQGSRSHHAMPRGLLGFWGGGFISCPVPPPSRR